MNFNMKNIHTIFESAEDKKPAPIKHGDETGANIDNTLASSDLIKLYDNICPITGDVFASMKDAAADPKNLKLTMVKTEDLGEAAVYVEAVEFATFCEAAGLNIGEAAEEIEDMCNDVTPGIQKSELHVVFPSDALNKDELGSMRYGADVQNDWAMQLMTGCRRYGVAVNSGVEDSKPVTEGFGRHFEHIEDREERSEKSALNKNGSEKSKSDNIENHKPTKDFDIEDDDGNTLYSAKDKKFVGKSDSFTLNGVKYRRDPKTGELSVEESAFIESIAKKRIPE